MLFLCKNVYASQSIYDGLIANMPKEEEIPVYDMNEILDLSRAARKNTFEFKADDFSYKEENNKIKIKTKVYDKNSITTHQCMMMIPRESKSCNKIITNITFNKTSPQVKGDFSCFVDDICLQDVNLDKVIGKTNISKLGTKEQKIEHIKKRLGNTKNTVNCPITCRDYDINDKLDIVKEQKISDVKEVINDTCNIIDQSGCKLVSTNCLDQSTRNIDGEEFNKCWNTQYNYECETQTSSLDTVNSVCSRKLVDIEVNHTPTIYKQVKHERCEINKACVAYSSYYDGNKYKPKNMPSGKSFYMENGKFIITYKVSKNNWQPIYKTKDSELRSTEDLPVYFQEMQDTVDNASCPSLCRVEYSENVVDVPSKTEITNEKYQDDCSVYKNNKDCRLISEKIIDQAVRSIGGADITRPWHIQETYQCHIFDNCSSYANNDKCTQIDSKCIDPSCYSLSKKYECSTSIRYEEIEEEIDDTDSATLAAIKDSIAHIESNYHNSDEEQNADFEEVLGFLGGVSSIKNNTRLDIGMFSGKAQSCFKEDIYIASGKIPKTREDCCGIGKVGKSCSKPQEYKWLAQQRQLGLCKFIGEKSKKPKGILGKTTKTGKKRKTEKYCCFGDALAIGFNEAARQYLGKGWGNFEQPDCSGFTPEEFSNAMQGTEVQGIFAKIAKEKATKINQSIFSPIDIENITKRYKNNDDN